MAHQERISAGFSWKCCSSKIAQEVIVDHPSQSIPSNGRSHKILIDLPLDVETVDTFPASELTLDTGSLGCPFHLQAFFCQNVSQASSQPDSANLRGIEDHVENG